MSTQIALGNLKHEVQQRRTDSRNPEVTNLHVYNCMKKSSIDHRMNTSLASTESSSKANNLVCPHTSVASYYDYFHLLLLVNLMKIKVLRQRSFLVFHQGEQT